MCSSKGKNRIIINKMWNFNYELKIGNWFEYCWKQEDLSVKQTGMSPSK